MPKYSFKRNFFCHMGGSLTESGLPTTPHMHCVGCTTHRVGCTTHFIGLTAHEYDKKHLINIKFRIFLSVLAFSRVKK